MSDYLVGNFPPEGRVGRKGGSKEVKGGRLQPVTKHGEEWGEISRRLWLQSREERHGEGPQLPTPPKDN